MVINLWLQAVIDAPMPPRMAAQLTCDALEMALWRQKRPEKVIVYTDGDSMSAKGCCYDNARVDIAGRENIKTAVFNYID